MCGATDPAKRRAGKSPPGKKAPQLAFRVILK
jgi:hypothetical protein